MRLEGSGLYGGRTSGSFGGVAGSQTTSRTVFEGDAPDIPDMPKFKAPEWNEKAIKKKTQRNAAPGVRQLRHTVQQAMGRNYENPNVRRMTMRDVLAGYGMGLEGVMAGAAQQAQQEYAQEYSKDYNAAQINYQTDVNALMASYNNAWRKYLSSGTQVTQQVKGAVGGSYDDQFHLRGL
jgi:hypothetical protein